MPRLVILNSGPDTAGCAIKLKRAMDKYAVGWETRAICRRVTHLDYPSDIVWPRGSDIRMRRKVNEIVNRADVVHVMDHQKALVPFRSLMPGKKLVVHHLGTHFRNDPINISAICQAWGATEVTDSITLLLLPHITWLPIAIDVDELAALREKHRRPQYPLHTTIRIAHAPTSREIKSTDTIDETIQKLSQRYPIEFDLIEGVSNRECLERKARADIFVDELTLGFGVNDIECWAMGIPVVSGLVDRDARHKALQMWGEIPWADAGDGSLSWQIERLIVDYQWREKLGQIGRQHVERWHSERAVVEQTLAVYKRAGLKIAA